MHTYSDDAITGEVKAAFAASPKIHSDEIKVYTEDGKVRIQGVVENLEEKLAAEATAMRVPGVRGIENDLTISADKSVSDLELERLAQASLNDLGLSDIGVRVEAGTAFLMGHIQDIAIEERAADVVSRVPGIRNVLSELEIAAGAPVDDIGLADDVAEALSEDPRIVFYDLDVQADEGHILLLGQVDTPAEVEFATQVAESVPGVRSVENRMSIAVPRGA